MGQEKGSALAGAEIARLGSAAMSAASKIVQKQKDPKVPSFYSLIQFLLEKVIRTESHCMKVVFPVEL